MWSSLGRIFHKHLPSCIASTASAFIPIAHIFVATRHVFAPVEPQGAVDGRGGCIGALVDGNNIEKGHLKNEEKDH